MARLLAKRMAEQKIQKLLLIKVEWTIKVYKQHIHLANKYHNVQVELPCHAINDPAVVLAITYPVVMTIITSPNQTRYIHANCPTFPEIRQLFRMSL